MKSNKKLWDICIQMYREMYYNADPSADWDQLIETGEAKQENFFRNYYLPEDQYTNIYNKICKEHKLTKRERYKVSFEINMGCSPTSVRHQWDDEEN